MPRIESDSLTVVQDGNYVQLITKSLKNRVGDQNFMIEARLNEHGQLVIWSQDKNVRMEITSVNEVTFDK